MMMTREKLTVRMRAAVIALPEYFVCRSQTSRIPGRDSVARRRRAIGAAPATDELRLSAVSAASASGGRIPRSRKP